MDHRSRPLQEFHTAHDLNETLIFVKVVEQGSFIAAANALGLPKTTVSRKVQELEQRLGARLLNHTTRRLGLTEAGSIYHEHCQRIARGLEDAESAVAQLQSGPRGWLRFTVPYSIGITWIAPLLGEYRANQALAVNEVDQAPFRAATASVYDKWEARPFGDFVKKLRASAAAGA